MNDEEWRLDEVIKGHYVWKLWRYPNQEPPGGVYIWNVTKDHNPPSGDAGYYSRQALLSMKGLESR